MGKTFNNNSTATPPSTSHMMTTMSSNGGNNSPSFVLNGQYACSVDGHQAVVSFSQEYIKISYMNRGRCCIPGVHTETRTYISKTRQYIPNPKKPKWQYIPFYFNYCNLGSTTIFILGFDCAMYSMLLSDLTLPIVVDTHSLRGIFILQFSFQKFFQRKSFLLPSPDGSGDPLHARPLPALSSHFEDWPPCPQHGPRVASCSACQQSGSYIN